MSPLSINTNIASLKARNQLAANTSSLAKTFERLSSGLRINSASDDLAGLAVASKLDVDIHVFNQGLRNVNDGISYLNVADGATSALKDMLNRIQELAAQASNGTLLNTQRGAIDSEAQALVTEYNKIIQTAEFNNIQIFSSSNTGLTVQAGYSQIAITGNVAQVAAGDGTFQARQSFATGFQPNSVAIADLNGDGQKDLVTADRYGGAVSVFLGNGNGTFQAKTDFLAGAEPYSVAIADFSGDGINDLVIADRGTNSVQILKGNGNGTFQAGQSFAVGTNPQSVATADFNGDGVKDLVTTDFGSSSASVLLGNGNGTFQARISYSTGSAPASVMIDDFNGDGIKDLATTDWSDNVTSVFQGNGNGTFKARQSFYSGYTPTQAASGDFNGDGIKDLAISLEFGDQVGVLLGNSNGTFKTTCTYATDPGPSSVATADLNGDGLLDLVTSDIHGGRNTLSVLMGNGNGTFQASRSFATGLDPMFVVIDDVNNDGIKDLITTEYSSDTVSVFLGNGTVSSSTSGPFCLSSMTGISLATQGAALSAQTKVSSYLQNVEAVAGTIGAGLSRFNTVYQTLSIMSENFQTAKSRIMDVDVALEAANLVRRRIIQQAGVAVLAQANQQPQFALSLLTPSSAPASGGSLNLGALGLGQDIGHPTTSWWR